MITKLLLAGAELWYERDGEARPITFQFDPKFFREFEECFIDITELYKPQKRIILAGAYVDKPGAHKLGRAADLDGIEFEDGSLWYATEYGRLTAAIQGVFMKHFGVVLGWTYNEEHADHLHVDDTGEWGFRRHSDAIVSYIQWVLGLGGETLKFDGLWGPKTEAAFWNDYGRRPMGTPTDEEYRTFLNFVVYRLFNQMKRERETTEMTTSPAEIYQDTLEKIRDLVAMALQEGDLTQTGEGQ